MTAAKRKKNEVDMINGPLLPKILIFSATVFLTNLMQLLFNTSDLVVVGRFAGNDALGAVGATGALTTLFVNLFIGFSVGVSVVCTHCYGSGDMKGFRETVTTSVSLSAICGTILAVGGFFLSRGMLELMDTPESLLTMAADYLKTYFLCMPALMFFNYGAAILRSIGNTKTPMIILGVSGLTNVVLNLIFVIVFKLGVIGVALATTVTQYQSAVMLIIHMKRTDSAYKIEKLSFKIYRDKLKKIMYIGIPNAIHGTIISLSNVFIQSSLNTFGDVAVTGSSAAANVESYVYQALNCFYQSSLNFVGQNFGAGKFDRIRRVQVICYTSVVICGLVLGVGAYLGGGQLMKIFIDDSATSELAIAYGLERMKMICAPYFLCGLMEVLTGVLCGLGRSVSPTIVSVLGFCGVRVIWILTVFKYHHTLTVLYASYPVSWIISFIALFSVYLYVRHKTFPKKGSAAPLQKAAE